MSCNCNCNQPPVAADPPLPPPPPPPPPQLERQNYPPAPPPTPNIEETRPTLDISAIDFEEDFSFPFVAVVAVEEAPNVVTAELNPVVEEAKNEKPKEASCGDKGSRKRKAK